MTVLCIQEVQMNHEEQKSAYDTLQAGLESNRSKLEQVDLLNIDYVGLCY